MTLLKLLVAAAAASCLSAAPLLAADPIPGVDVKLGKNPGGGNAQTSGAESPASAQTEETVNINLQTQSAEEIGTLSAPTANVGVLSHVVLSGTVTGSWTGDDSMDMAAKAPHDDRKRIDSGDITSEFSAPGVLNILQNTGVFSLQQGVTSMPVSSAVTIAP